MNGLMSNAVVFMILAGLIILTDGSEIQDGGNFSCIDCAGVIGEITNCGEVIDPYMELTTVNCSGFCTKQVQYFIDQKIRVERNCTEECTQGCTMELGTSTCVYCCQEDHCNEATRLLPAILSVALTNIALILTVMTA